MADIMIDPPCMSIARLWTLKEGKEWFGGTIIRYNWENGYYEVSY